LDRILRSLENDEDARPIIWFAAVPVARARDHVPANDGVLREIVKNSSYYEAYPLLRNRSSRPTPKLFIDNCRPSLHGIGIDDEGRSMGRFEVRRDGTIVFGTKVLSPTLVHPAWVYETWYSGLHLLKDIQRRFSLSELAVTQAGLIGCGGRATKTDYRIPDDFIPDDLVALDTIMTFEGWEPRAFFDAWSLQFGNLLGYGFALPQHPWVIPERS